MLIDRKKDIALLLLRLTFGGAMFYGHGLGKLMRLFSEGPIEFGDPIGLGPVTSLALTAFAEGICSILVALGLFTRWATVPLIIAMFVAAFVVHWGDPFGRMEKALMYLVMFISLLLTGPGWYSLDARFRSGL